MANIGFIVSHPTQFEAPFFKYVQSLQDQPELKVLFWKKEVNYDPELKRSITWGFDVLDGYDYEFMNPGDEQAFRNWITRENISLLITNGYKDPYNQFGTVAKEIGCKLALRIDTVDFGKGIFEMQARKFILGNSYRKFDTFFSTGTATDRYCRKMGIPEKKIAWFPYCSNNDLFIPFFKNTKREIDFLAVCKFNERENPLELIEAFCRINDPALKLVMIGDGELRPEMESIANQHSHLQIELPGYVPFLQLPEWYGNSKVFVHTARNEPWGVSAQEALAAGCALVLSDHTGSSEDLLHPGKNGFAYPVKDKDALSSALLQALNLNRQEILFSSEKILEKWNYEQVWKEIKTAFYGITDN